MWSDSRISGLKWFIDVAIARHSISQGSQCWCPFFSLALKKLASLWLDPSGLPAVKVEPIPRLDEQASVVSQSLSLGEGREIGLQFLRCSCDFLKIVGKSGDQFTESADCLPDDRDSRGEMY